MEAKNEISRPRHVLALPQPTLESFCQLATERVRLHDATFPVLDPSALRETYRFYCGYHCELDARVDRSGWTMTFDSRDVGPAEVIHEEDWVATAQGGSFRLVLRSRRAPPPRWCGRNRDSCAGSAGLMTQATRASQCTDLSVTEPGEIESAQWLTKGRPASSSATRRPAR